MRALVLAILFASGPAWAVCPAHSPTITASATGGFQLCAPETDVDGDPVTAAFYQSCTVTATWQSGAKSAFVTLAPITPGVTQIVGFPAAKGPGTGVGFCTNADSVAGASNTAVVTFRRGTPGKPGLSQ